MENSIVNLFNSGQNQSRFHQSSMRRVLVALTGVLALLLAVQPQTASATTIAAAVCTVSTYPCPPGFTVDAGARSNGVATLGSNRYALLPFGFNDVNASFNGTVLVTDIARSFVDLDVTGVANNNFTSGFWLDVWVTQNYLTRPGVWGFTEWNIGAANAAAVVGGLSGTGDADQLVVNGFRLPALGYYGDATLGAWAFGAGPFLGRVGAVTNMTGLAQFYFSPGLLGQAMTIPMDVDLPDPALGGVLPSPSNIGTIAGELGLQPVPEPGSLMLLGSGLAGAGGILRKRLHNRS